jgi:hypothetical protein
VLVPIDCKLECEALGASLMAPLLVSTLVRLSSVYELEITVRLSAIPPHHPSLIAPYVDRATAIEALRRSQYKFPGRQKIIVSKNWGFTPLRREEYLEKRAEGRFKVDGAYVQFLSNHGKIEDNVKRFPDAFTSKA